MPCPIHVLGGAQTDFARNIAREGKELCHLFEEVTLAALADASVTEGDVETVHVGNAFGELFAGQAQLGVTVLRSPTFVRSMVSKRTTVSR